ncbi:MAG TPA: alpha/beta hydrolase-fold protein [Acidobacteriaceae bacterium]|nr:alpha/beta hydrolase-fold protein [Acidobacteriaceae bacterium]
MTRFRNVVLSEPLPGSGVRLVTFDSPALRRRGEMSVWLPWKHKDEPLPLLILLHGVYGSHWNWWALGKVPDTAGTMIAAGSMPFAIVMPSDGLWSDGSGYVPHRDFDAESWVMEDVPGCLAEAFPQIRTNVFYLGGLSMGGYGALRMGMKYAGKVRGISAHSAVTSLEDLQPHVIEPIEAYRFSGPDNTEIAHWARTNRANLPPIRFDCGLDDALLASNRALHAMLVEQGIPHEYEEFDGGHTWEYWRTYVRRTLRFVSELEAHTAHH